MSRIEDDISIRNTLARFWLALDDRDYETLLGLLIEEAVWVRRGTEVRGREAIAKSLEARRADIRVRHVMTNLVVDFPSSDRAEATYYMTAYFHQGDVQEGNTLPVPHPITLVVYRDTLMRTAGSWKFTDKRPRTVAFRDSSALS